MAYLTAQRILYGGNKQELSRQTGIALRTLFNRQNSPEKTTIQELAYIAKARGLSGAEVMEILEDLA